MTGQPLTSKDLIKLHFHKNNKGEYHCPVTYKVISKLGVNDEIDQSYVISTVTTHSHEL